MPWNETTRAEYMRPSSRYESDLTDAEWSLLDPIFRDRLRPAVPAPRTFGKS